MEGICIVLFKCVYGCTLSFVVCDVLCIQVLVFKLVLEGGERGRGEEGEGEREREREREY